MIDYEACKLSLYLLGWEKNTVNDHHHTWRKGLYECSLYEKPPEIGLGPDVTMKASVWDTKAFLEYEGFYNWLKDT